MSENKKAKANPDYSASAVNLTNDKRLEDLLDRLRIQEGELEESEAEVEALIPDPLKETLYLTKKQIKNLTDDIRQTIDEFGSYQNVDIGAYAVKQRKESITYLPEKVKTILPDFALIVIEESVNKKAFEGLVKGGLITEAEATQCGIVAMSYAYIIKV